MDVQSINTILTGEAAWAAGLLVVLAAVFCAAVTARRRLVRRTTPRPGNVAKRRPSMLSIERALEICLLYTSPSPRD